MTMKPSTRYHSSRDFKVLVDEEQVIGYVVVKAGSRGGASYVAPIYHSDVYAKTTRNGKTVTHIFSRYEIGERLNGYDFNEDYHGCMYADIAASAISALEFGARMRKAREETKPKRSKRSKRLKKKAVK